MPNFIIIRPENPARIFPGSIIKDVNKAYWTAVYCLETKLVKKVILTVPTMPAAILSRATTRDNNARDFSDIAIYAKNKLVIITKKAPIIREFLTPADLINLPPTKKTKNWGS